MSKTKKILIAEDEGPIGNAMALKLRTCGYEVQVAPNGKAALELLEKETFDLMLLDLIMPQMDGFEVLEKLKEKGNKMPIIVTSNLGQEEDKKQAFKMGAFEYLVKADTPLHQIVDMIKKKLK